ncbi:MAG: 50S ribosomal protein L23 [Candidatus Nomurabacteria bacterium GW2011_GWB1_37_5]|uniref:Large ribosomal subunit protein uL23 n=1 Tax=Candidatus Nomurabacteria bacterium GW2011_GWB1_37_5 TaxID=1618742 RepID=A0A0G0GTE2_9BACT|nr:MAG: 50S ribosomal protein L23 [Candidatus Nomurabacteria bacterium GW2011_GWB1_37_5]
MNDYTKIIKSPRITEKATMAGGNSVYVFNIDQSGTKIEVKKAIEKIFKVKPIKIRLVKIPRKAIFTRGRFGYKKGGQKAYVYLKKGEKIEI